MLPTHR